MKNKKLASGVALGVLSVAVAGTVTNVAMNALESKQEATTASKKNTNDLRTRDFPRIASSIERTGKFYVSDEGRCYFSHFRFDTVATAMRDGEGVFKVQLVTDNELLEDGTYGEKPDDEQSPMEFIEDLENGYTDDDGTVVESTKIPHRDTVLSEFEGWEGTLELDKTLANDDVRVKYWIRDTDGNESYCYDALAYLVPELERVFSYEVHTEEPTITHTGFDGEISAEGFITRNGILSFELADELGIDDTSITAKIGDKDLAMILEENTLKINTNQIQDGEYDIVIELTDLAGNPVSLTHHVKLLRESPVITGESHSNAEFRSGVTYVKTTLTGNLSGYDNPAIASIDLLKEETVVQNLVNGYFEIGEDGYYRIKVTDIAGNVTIYKLEDLFSDLCSTIYCDNVLPTYEFKINGEDPTEDWYTEGALVSFKGIDEKEIDSVSIEVDTGNDTIQVFQTSRIASGSVTEVNLEIDLDKDCNRPSDGVYRLNCSVRDRAGNEQTFERIVHADFDDPTFDKVNLDGNYYISDNKMYVAGELEFSAEPKDVGSGVDIVNVYRDGELVSTSLPVEIKANGRYTFRISDVAGRVSKEYTLGELLNLDDKTISDVIIDKEPPIISEVSGFTPDLVHGYNWYKSYPKLRVGITDNNLDTVTATINNEEVGVQEVSPGVFEIDTEGIDGEAKLKVIAIDKAKNQKSYAYDYAVDREAPKELKGTLNKVPKNRFGELFFNSEPTVTFTGSDDVGIEKYFINGDEIKGESYKLKTGRYNVYAQDLLGNKSKVQDLKDVIGLESNSFVIDTKNPEIVSQRPKGSKNGWFGKDVTYDVNITDDIGINSATVKINGKIVDSFEASESGVKETKLEGNTSKATPNPGGLYSVVVDVEDNAGNKSSWSDTIYIDKVAPSISKFIFTGNGVVEGVNINGTDRYGFFFKGGATCDIHVTDGEASSGIEEVIVNITPENGTSKEEHLKVDGGVAHITLPNGFKGTIDAYAIDKVGNVGSINRPDGIVTEDSNTHINSTNIDIQLPTTAYTDITGNNLYSTDVTATAVLGCKKSGIRKLEWGTDNETKGVVEVDTNGNLAGNVSAIATKDKNLVLDLNGTLPVLGNANGINIWVRLTDRAGNVSESYRVISIDKDVPEIGVTWDITEPDGYYNGNRTANIVITERNFDPSQVSFQGMYGTLGSWVNMGDTWRNTISFSEDNKYQFSITCTDRAGNTSQTYNSESFTIDKTAPVISVYWDNNSYCNANYFNSARTATITVIEDNFDPSKISLSGTGVLSAWSHNGNSHTARLAFTSNGAHEFSISCTDLADNGSNMYTEPQFIIDTGEPTLTINGVQNGISYKKDVSFTVSMADDHIDQSRTEVHLTGRKNGEIELTSSLNEKTGLFELTGFPEGADFDDIYTLFAVVYDMAGNSKEETLMFSLNRFGSKYTFSDGELLGNYTNKAKDVEVVEENIDQLEISKSRVVLLKDGKDVELDESLVSVTEIEAEAGYNYIYGIKSGAFKSDGKYQVQVYSKAIEGTQYSNVSEEYEFVLDSKKPDIIISGIDNDGRYNAYEKTVSIDVRDTYGVRDIEVMLNGKRINVEKKDGIYSFNVRENKEKQYINVVAYDMAGNMSEKKIDGFYISSNALQFLVNQLWFKIGVGAMLTFLGILIGLIIKNIKDSKKREYQALEEHEELYRSTVTSSNLGTDGNHTADKDIAENLEK